MREIAPGLVHWTTYHPNIRSDVSSYFVVEAGALLDPMLPPEGPEALARFGTPRVVLLTNRHHLRASGEFGVPVRCHEAGLHEFERGDVAVEGFAWGDEVAPGIHALEVDAISPEETALRIDAADALAFADGLIRYGELGFVPDDLIGDDPEEVKRGLRAAYRRIAAEHPSENLLFAHGEPLVGGGSEALARFAHE